jgi:hypothetical protein
MSHIIEEYAKSLGTKPGKPQIDLHFYPISLDRYVTVDTSSVDSLNYQHFESVINLIKQYDPSIKFVDITESREKGLEYFDKSLLGKCSYRHISYIISKAELHLCVDTFSSYIASAFNVPTVCLYGPMYPENSKPIWDGKLVCLFECPTDTKPSYSGKDPNSIINLVSPEKVAKECLSLIGVENDLDCFTTINIGKYYKDKILEVIPDFVPHQEYKPDRLVNLRCDYNFDQEIISKWMQFKVNLMLDKALDIDLIVKYANNIAGITLFLGDKSLTSSYVSTLQTLNLNPSLICKDESIISDIRLDFFGSDVEEYKVKSKKDLDFVDEVCDNCFYDSNKILKSKNKIYKSRAAWKIGQTTDKLTPIIDSPDFWEEIEHFNIYKYDRKN